MIEADLAIIGGGPAGISIARALRGRGPQIALIEGGGLEPSKASQDLYQGEMVTKYRGEMDANYLTNTRLRYFGGSSNHWSGWCRPLDAADFQQRDWVPDSGWPITRADLQPWYLRAAKLVSIKPLVEDLHRWSTSTRPPMKLPPPVRTRLFHYSAPPTRFAHTYRKDITSSPDIALHLNTSLIRLVAGAGGVTSAECVGPDGKPVQVKARAFVLATGGIENARQLLISGLGNDHDLVGRYFMEHPNAMRAGRMVVGGASMDLYGGIQRDPVLGGRSRGILTLDPSFREQQRLLNACLYLWKFDEGPRDELEQSMGELAHELALMAGLDVLEQPLSGAVIGIGEQRPNRDSRVTLGDDKDALGQPRARVDWRLTDEDADSLRQTIRHVGHTLGSAHTGMISVRMSKSQPWKRTRGGAHHMGTTRMHASADKGVVDANCRVHGLANLYIAGSSVFPTSGFANPTLTILALALRLSEHLSGELSP